MLRRHVALPVSALLVAALVGPSRAQAVTALLPDLRQAPVGCAGGYTGDLMRCADWDVCAVADPAAPNGQCLTSGLIGAVRLRFTTSVDNTGDGPLVIHGSRGDTGQPMMSARQAFQSVVDGEIPATFEQAQHPLPAQLYYEPAASHVHWHLLGFEHFQLRTPGGDAVVSDRKTGFCLGDRYTVADPLANRPGGEETPQGRFAGQMRRNRCGHHAPDATAVTLGISVGSGDDYRHTVDFQWLDITEVPSGVYDVVNVVNGDRALVEKSYTNNTSSMAIRVSWPGNRGKPVLITAPPRVTVLAQCPGQERCASALR